MSSQPGRHINHSASRRTDTCLRHRFIDLTFPGVDQLGIGYSNTNRELGGHDEVKLPG